MQGKSFSNGELYSTPSTPPYNYLTHPNSAKANKKTLIVPDKDADGLSSGAILRQTLILLGLDESLITIHLLRKSSTVHHPDESALMASHNPAYIFVLDQGSRNSPPLIPNPSAISLVIDHHHAASQSDFPANSSHVTACNSPPVATASLLTYHICTPLHPSVPDLTAWLAVVGTHGDLGTALKWQPPFPDMTQTFKTHKKGALNAVVSLLNAPRRTPAYDVRSAWNALTSPSAPASILTEPRLLAAKQEVAAEVVRWSHTAPAFSADGKVAVFRIQSVAQVHPLIATRWAGSLKSNSLEFVMCANEGYAEGKVNFSCRVAKCAKGREPEVDIIRSLRGYASMPPQLAYDGGVDGADEENVGEEGTVPSTSLLERVGEDFARGHVQASGGIVGKAEFEELMGLMRVGVKKAAAKKEGGEKSSGGASGGSKKKGGVIDSGQKNTLAGYFGKVA
jgi:hypothetical protein